MFSTVLSLFSALALSRVAIAAPIQPVELLAWSPSIITPDASTVWTSGSAQTVTWKTDNIPAEKQNSTGLLLLGYMENNSENLDISMLILYPCSEHSH